MRAPRILFDARRFLELRSEPGQVSAVEDTLRILLRLGIVPIGTPAIHETHVSFDVVGQRIHIQHRLGCNGTAKQGGREPHDRIQRKNLFSFSMFDNVASHFDHLFVLGS
jgi:hypothetical protein